MPRTKARFGPWHGALAALVAGYAVVALQSGLDRASRSQPTLERLVWGPFRSDATIARARQDLASNQPSRLLSARAAVEAQPSAATSTGLLGTALLLVGGEPQADAAFRISAMGGWRDGATQLYWAEQSAQAGEWDMAVARVDAILRYSPELQPAHQARDALARLPGGREALARTVGQRPPWLGSYARFDNGIDDAAATLRAEVMAEAGRTVAPLGCDNVRPATFALLQRGLLNGADALWQANCPGSDRIAALGDADFARVDDAQDPAGWTVRPDGDLSVSGERQDGRTVARVENNGRAAQPVLQQPVALGTGRRILRWQAREGDAVSDRIGVALDCGTPKRPPVGGDKREVAIPDCPMQTLSIWLAPGQGEVLLDRVEVAVP